MDKKGKGMKCKHSQEWFSLGSSYDGQFKCQGECLKNDDCVGIVYGYNEGNGDKCQLCLDDDLTPDISHVDVGFYRNVEGKQCLLLQKLIGFYILNSYFICLAFEYVKLIQNFSFILPTTNTTLPPASKK